MNVHRLFHQSMRRISQPEPARPQSQGQTSRTREETGQEPNEGDQPPPAPPEQVESCKQG